MKLEETIKITLHQLCQIAEKNDDMLKKDIDNAIGEVEIGGVEYQIQLSLIADKRRWMKEEEVRFSEVTRILD